MLHQIWLPDLSAWIWLKCRGETPIKDDGSNPASLASLDHALHSTLSLHPGVRIATCDSKANALDFTYFGNISQVLVLLCSYLVHTAYRFLPHKSEAEGEDNERRVCGGTEQELD